MWTRRWARALGATGAAIVVALAALPAAPAVADESNGDDAHPTFIGGRIVGDDHRAVNVLIGVDAHDENGEQIDPNGNHRGDPGARFCGGYSWCENPNPTISAMGEIDPTLNRTWGRWVSADIAMVFIELYPRNPSGRTDKSRYASAAHYSEPVASGEENLIDLLLPVSWENDRRGNTGWAEGAVTYSDGEPIPPGAIRRFRAWTMDPGSACGIQGFSAGVSELTWRRSGLGEVQESFYKMSHLVAGQCTERSQTYWLDATVIDHRTGERKFASALIEVYRGKATEVDLVFDRDSREPPE